MPASPKTFTAKLSRGELRLAVIPMGEDLLLALSGGDAPHIGTALLSLPRESLAGPGRSATSSILNVPGHMDDIPARRIAERFARERGVRIACVCGIHFDAATPELLQEILDASDALAQKALQALD